MINALIDNGNCDSDKWMRVYVCSYSKRHAMMQACSG